METAGTALPLPGSMESWRGRWTRSPGRCRKHSKRLPLPGPPTDLIPGAGQGAPPVVEPSESPVSADPAPVLDLVKFEAMTMSNPALRARMVLACLQRSRVALSLIEQAVNRDDAASVQVEAQRLIGMTTSLGAVSCAGIFHRLESMARDGSLAGAGPLLGQAYAELNRVEVLAAA